MTEAEYELRARYHKLEGYSEAIANYGVWKDGKQWIGTIPRRVTDIEYGLQMERDDIDKKVEAMGNEEN